VCVYSRVISYLLVTTVEEAFILNFLGKLALSLILSKRRENPKP